MESPSQFDRNDATSPPHPGEEPEPERTYSGDMVLLFLFFAIAAVLGLLLVARSQAG